jgi:hypothetical protein
MYYFSPFECLENFIFLEEQVASLKRLVNFTEVEMHLRPNIFFFLKIPF